LIQDLPVNNLLDQATFHNGLGDSDRHLCGSQNSHNTTHDYEKFYCRCFLASRQGVDSEQEEADEDAWDPIQCVPCTR
jgi:hypothetical protein